MSAIRMFAYGVLVMPPPMPTIVKGSEGFEEYWKRRGERQEIKNMVMTEMKVNGYLLKSHIEPFKSGKYYTSKDRYDLFGPLDGTKAIKVRAAILTGVNLRECCIAVLRILEPENTSLPTPPSTSGGETFEF